MFPSSPPAKVKTCEALRAGQNQPAESEPTMLSITVVDFFLAVISAYIAGMLTGFLLFMFLLTHDIPRDADAWPGDPEYPADAGEYDGS